jgi:hypothetical protein
MCVGRRVGNIVAIAVGLISVSGLGQQLQQDNRSSMPATPGSAAAPAAAAPPLTSTPKGPASQIASNASSGEAMPMGLVPALRAILAPNRRPARGDARRIFLDWRNEVGIFAAGNINPVSSISIQNTPHSVVSSNKSSIGGGAEYRHWITDRSALGLLYTQNPSDGKLLWQGQNSIWPQMRWDISVLATESFHVRKIAPFVSAGPGVVVTNGHDNSGWSAGLAFVAGLGADYQLNRRFSARTGITFLDTKSGCYDDPTCHESWGVVEDLRVGVVYRWGAKGGE